MIPEWVSILFSYPHGFVPHLSLKSAETPIFTWLFMAACRTVNMNMLWQQTLNQPLVTAGWNDLKTCVTFWPNLGWCSTSLIRTEARTALMTSDFHYKPAVDPNVHSGWDRGYNGSAAPFGQECACSLVIHWAMAFSPLRFTHLALKSSDHFLLFTTAYEHQLSQGSVCQQLLWFSFALQLSPWRWMVWHCGLLPVNKTWSRFESLVCVWLERYVKYLVLAQIPVWLDVTSMWIDPGRDESSASALASWIEASFSLDVIINLLSSPISAVAWALSCLLLAEMVPCFRVGVGRAKK